MMRSQRQTTIQRNVQQRQLLLNQLDSTFVVLNLYFNALASGDAEMAGVQNEASASLMNALRGQVALAKARGDQEALLMGRAKVAEFVHESEGAFGGDAEANGAMRNYTGYMMAALSGKDVPALPSAPMPTDSVVINEAVGDLLSAMHDTEAKIKQVQQRPSEFNAQQRRLADEGKRLMREGAADGSFEEEALTRHFQVEKTFYRSRQAHEKPQDVQFGVRDGCPDIGGEEYKHADHDHDHVMSQPRIEPGAAFERKFARDQSGQWVEVEVIEVRGGEARVRLVVEVEKRGREFATIHTLRMSQLVDSIF